MRSLLHVFYTWVLAHLLHFFILWVYGFIIGDSGEPGFLLVFAVIGFVGSIPALFTAFGLLHLLRQATIPAAAKAVLWLLILLGLVILSFCLIILFIGGITFVQEALHFAIPALLAVSISLLLRLQQLAHYFFTLSKNIPT